jgi:hypothetical protein
MKGDQSFLSRFEEGGMAAKLQTVRDQEVRWVHQSNQVA